MKATFRAWYEWSDWSEFSPQCHGQLPMRATLPDGRQVSLAQDDIFSFFPKSRAVYIPLDKDGRVRVHLTSWGDDGSRRMGRAGSRLEIIVPKGTVFGFARTCGYCGQLNGWATEAELGQDGRAESLNCPDCTRKAAVQEVMMEAILLALAAWEAARDAEQEALLD